MAKIIAVVGATGAQGSSIVKAFLNNAEYKVRGITRNPKSSAAQSLAALDIEVVQGDLNDEQSLQVAFSGAYAIFAVTNFFEPFFNGGGTPAAAKAAMEIEYTQATNMAKAASITEDLQHYLWSTLPNSRKLSHGAHVVPHFDAKSRADEFIKQDKALLAKTTFLWIPFYDSNLYYFPNLTPIYLKTAQKFILTSPIDPNTPIVSVGDTRNNIGLFVYAVVSNPPKSGGMYVLCAADTHTSLSNYLATWGRGSGLLPTPGSTAVVQISFQDYCQLWPGVGEEIAIMLQFWEALQGRSWTSASDEVVEPVQNLMTQEQKDKIIGSEAAFRSLNWESLKLI